MNSKSITVRFPTSIISSSICLAVLATTSSIRAGESSVYICVKLNAISLRTGSKQERMIASQCIIYNDFYPVAASSALMFRPSRPIILPLTSSDSMLNTDTQFSTASSVPTLCVNDDFFSFVCC
jgi:hypothetical protein